MNLSLYVVLTSMLASFVAVGLRGFQQKNVQGDHYKLVWFTSYGICIGDAVSIGYIAKFGLIMALPAGTGAATGMVLAMWLHNRYVTKRST